MAQGRGRAIRVAVRATATELPPPFRRHRQRGSSRREETGVREEGERSEAEMVPVTSVCLCHYRPAAPRCLAGASNTVTGVLRPPEPLPELLATFVVAGKSCRRRDWNSSPLPLEVAAGLPPSQFGDCRCVGSAVPPSVRC
ncbi:uncharacterized protein LOC107485497 isoform X1 [Arachis duranensis]|uniref:Uncharacterized protein LOC107485497 isoform X1 n=1 Tax=Arachis duranensis TaxID=130453 RepID=A0A9C6WPC5_ARADU|nr:uncharacterized protein LOC107485497 isoform X1 [Arachis duranensis]